ncbi:GNAT family N-acetyltransferase [Mycoplasmatota bacterium zrk1]
MNKIFEYRIEVLKVNALENALTLIKDVFMEFEAPDYNNEGIKNFIDFIEISSIKNLTRSHILSFWGCYDKEKLVGVIATKQMSHISMLFVDKCYHRKGIAKNLFKTILKNAIVKNIKEITVNSSPYAVEFYHKLGFLDTKIEQTIDGIRFTPMKMSI